MTPSTPQRWMHVHMWAWRDVQEEPDKFVLHIRATIWPISTCSRYIQHEADQSTPKKKKTFRQTHRNLSSLDHPALRAQLLRQSLHTTAVPGNRLPVASEQHAQIYSCSACACLAAQTHALVLSTNPLLRRSRCRSRPDRWQARARLASVSRASGIRERIVAVWFAATAAARSSPWPSVRPSDLYRAASKQTGHGW